MQKPTLSLVKTALEEIESLTTQKASKTRRCCECFTPISIPDDSPRWRELDVKCEDCTTKADMARASRDNDEREARYNAVMASIPATFRNTIRERLPDPTKLDSALLWKFGPSGLLLYGQTGCGKSRVAWEIIKREALTEKTIKCLDSFQLAKYPSLFMADTGAADRFADELVRVDLLLLDDIFKAKATERVEELIFAVLDERGQWERPCIITLNDTGDTLTTRLSLDRGPALIRRMREYCQTIKF